MAPDVSPVGAPSPGWLHRLLPAYAGNRRLLLFATAVSLLGAVAVLRAGGPVSGVLTIPFAVWLAISVAAELLWLETLSGEGTDSMASTVNLSVLYLFGGGLALWIIALSVFLATRFLQRRDWFRTCFGFGQIAITAGLSAAVFRLLHPQALRIASIREPETLGAMVAAATVYFFVNTGLVAGAVALQHGTPLVETWRRNYGYRNSVVSAIALFALSPLLCLSYLTLGYPGVVLFFVPLLIIRNQNREYINLQKLTQALIASERMAAKGDFAASVAHEINNYLAVLSGRAQLLILRAQKIGDESMKNDVEIIRRQVEKMRTLTKGMLDFSHKEVRIAEFDLNRLVTETADFMRLQNLFDRVELVTVTDPELGEVQADAGQLQQVLLNLIKNAAEAIRDARPPLPPGRVPDPSSKDGRIEVRVSRAGRGRVRVSVVDDGPGMSKATAGRIFEPGVTIGKADGHGYGLSTCWKILENHHGRIWVESEEGKGAAFHFELPRRQAPAAEAPTGLPAGGAPGARADAA